MPAQAKSAHNLAIKIGGSLYNSQYLKPWLDTICECTDTKIVVIPGGGPFADQVRQADEKFDLSPLDAHLMAVMAMQQYSGVLKSLQPLLDPANSIESIQLVWKTSNIALWEPFEMVRDQCKLAESWDISSDSLAVWIAGKLKIENLLLVKSADQVLEDTSLEALIEDNCIDAGIIELAQAYHVKIHLSHKSNPSDLSTFTNIAYETIT